WTRSQATAEGNLLMNTMQQSWRRSLAGIVLCAAMGASTDTASAQPLVSYGADEDIYQQARAIVRQNEAAQARAREKQELAAIRIGVFQPSSREWKPAEMQLIQYVFDELRHRLQEPPRRGEEMQRTRQVSWRLAVDDRTRLLIVSGTERDLQAAANLAKVL